MRNRQLDQMDLLILEALQVGAVLHHHPVVAVGIVTDDQCGGIDAAGSRNRQRSEEHTSELQSLMRISYAVFCLKKKKNKTISTYMEYRNKDDITYICN